MLEIRKISKTFHAGTPNEVRALQGIDVTIDDVWQRHECISGK